MKVSLASSGSKRTLIDSILGDLTKCLVLLSLVFAVGCSSKKCLFQSDCGEGQVCAESECRQACDEMRQCPADFVCENGACYADEPVVCDDGGSCDVDMGMGEAMQSDMALVVDMMSSQSTDSGMMMQFDSAVALDAGLEQMDMQIVDMSLPLDAATVDDSRFNLTGSYMVVHTLVFANGGALSEEGQERNNIELTAISNNRYRVEVRDDVGREVLYVDPAVNFAHRDGVGFYDFQYPWNREVDEECYYVEIRSQNGSYRQGPRGYTMQGRENRSVCTCLPEPINARVPVIDPIECTGTYYDQVFDVEWIPW